MDHKSKIYEAIQYPFEKRKDDRGREVSCNVRKAEERLRALNLSKEELEVLKEEYEVAYDDRKLNLVQVIVLFGIFLSAVIAIGEAVFPEVKISEVVFPCNAGVWAIPVFVIVCCISFTPKIRKVSSDHASFRDYRMAIAILLWEKKQNEAALVHGENGTEA